jgi:hypothetical protein
MRAFRLLLGMLLMGAILIVFWDLSLNRRLAVIGFEEGHEVGPPSPLPWTDIGLNALALIVGIVFGAAHEQWMARPDDRIRLSDFWHTLTTGRSLASLVAAPLLFTGVYAVARSQPDRVVALLFAFQNGFFCKSVLRSYQNQSESGLEGTGKVSGRIKQAKGNGPKNS